jgi:hypothetical protein
LVAGRDRFIAMVRRLPLQVVRPDCFDFDLDLGRMGPRIELVGERFLTPKSSRFVLGLIVDRLTVALLVACLVHHEGEHSGEHECRHCGDEDQNCGVGTDIGPSNWQSLAGIQSNEYERRHRADRDPKEEQRAGRPREVISEHGEIGRRVARPSVAQHADDRDDRSGELNN